MTETEDTEKGRRLLLAVQRILDKPEKLIQKVERLKEQAKHGDDAERLRREVGRRIIKAYSNRAAISGGAASVPAVIPGVGTLVALAGGALLDVGLLLKFEVEMAMSLSHLYGFDIKDERERQIAFLMASVHTYEAKGGQNVVVDLALTEGTAIWTYAPREISKLLVTVLTKLALIGIGKGFILALPVVGIAVGSGMNKVLTTQVGKRCVGELDRRRRFGSRQARTI